MVEEGSGGERAGAKLIEAGERGDHGEPRWLWEDPGFHSSEMESRREGFEGEVTRPYLILSVTPAVFLRVSCRSKTKNCGDPVGRIPSEKGGFIHRGVGRP